MAANIDLKDFYRNDKRMRTAIKAVIYLILAFLAFYIVYATYKITTGKHIIVPILGDINPIVKTCDTITNTVFIHDTTTIYKLDSNGKGSALQDNSTTFGTK